MNKKVETIVAFLEEKYGKEINDKYGKDKIVEIIVNCISLTETWFSRLTNKAKMSYELKLFNDGGVLVETLHGITKENAALSISDILINNNNKYSKVSLDSFSFNDGQKVVNNVGEIEIY